MANIVFKTKAIRQLSRDLASFINTDKSMPPTSDAEEIAKIAIQYIIDNPERLDRSEHSLTIVLRKLLISQSVGFLFIHRWNFTSRGYPYLSIARWLLDHRVRIMLSLNPKFK